MALDQDREIYPNAPLKLVAFELRFPPVPIFESESGKQSIYERLRGELPILGPPPAVTVEVVGGTARQRVLGTRLIDRRRLRTMTISEDAFTVETSAYVRFEEFLELIKMGLDVIHEIGTLPAVQRMGLRYIDEIAVPGVEDVQGWHDYIVDDLLAPASFQGFETLDYRGALGLSVATDHAVAIRFGVVNAPVVDPNGPLRISNSPEGSYFLLDIDSAWTAPTAEFAEFDPELVLARCHELHDPVRTIFERAIKEKLRDEVFRRKETNV